MPLLPGAFPKTSGAAPAPVVERAAMPTELPAAVEASGGAPRGPNFG